MKPLLAIAIMLLPGVASAGSNCYQLGNQWVCDGNGGGGSWNTQTYQLGNQSITSGTYRDRDSGQTRSFNRTCYWLGNQRICD
jgi:hypothetical protein